MQGEERRWPFLFPKTDCSAAMCSTACSCFSSSFPKKTWQNPSCMQTSWVLSVKRVRRKERKPWKESELEGLAAVSRGKRGENWDLREEPYHQNLLKSYLKTWGKTNILPLAGCYTRFQTKRKGWKLENGRGNVLAP